MAGSHVNNGIILVPDSCNLTEDIKEETFLAANYNATTEEEKEEIEKICTGETVSEFSKNLNEKDIKNIKIFDKKCECYEWFKIC